MDKRLDTFFKQSLKNIARSFSSAENPNCPGTNIIQILVNLVREKKEIVSKQFINPELVSYIPNSTRNNTNKVVILKKRIHKNRNLNYKFVCCNGISGL